MTIFACLLQAPVLTIDQKSLALTVRIDRPSERFAAILLGNCQQQPEVDRGGPSVETLEALFSRGPCTDPEQGRPLVKPYARLLGFTHYSIAGHVLIS